jgi:hypothetical protein
MGHCQGPDHPPDDEHDPDEGPDMEEPRLTGLERFAAWATVSGVLLQGTDLYLRLRGGGS